MSATLTRPNKRQRRADALLAHYANCEALYSFLNTPEGSSRNALHPNGKRISVALLKIERDAHNAATAQCNGEAYLGQPYRADYDASGEESEETPWGKFCAEIESRVEAILGKLPPGFFFNKDPRGYALKLQPDSVPIALQTDWGGYQLLSPEIS